MIGDGWFRPKPEVDPDYRRGEADGKKDAEADAKPLTRKVFKAIYTPQYEAGYQAGYAKVWKAKHPEVEVELKS